MTTRKYETWSKEDLISRIVQLERERASQFSSIRPDDIHPPIISQRKIAIKFCYSGWLYNGLAAQSDITALPTVEQVLFDALVKTRLIHPDGGYEACGWEKCGRTDKGVSAAGQVISLWVRSALNHPKDPDTAKPEASNYSGNTATASGGALINDSSFLDGDTDDGLPSLDIDDFGSLSENTSAIQKAQMSRTVEFNYIQLLNRVLPPTIRILAWSPVTDNFSARFNCRWRHYKYFFSPKFLDVSLMKTAASLMVGEHDFRNLCKIDPAKQITEFKRSILRADIGPVSEKDDAMFVLDLVGSAFLYHQVRHIMAILLLVGSGLEKSSIVEQLLHVEPLDAKYEAMTRKPEYQMADGLPLLLWDCGYPNSDVRWQIDPANANALTVHGNHQVSGRAEETGSVQLSSQDFSGVQQILASIHERSLVETTLNAHFLVAGAKYHPDPPLYTPNPGRVVAQPGELRMNVPLGGGTFRRSSTYVPLMLRQRNDTVEEINERYRCGKGGRRAAKKAEILEPQTEDNGDE